MLGSIVADETVDDLAVAVSVVDPVNNDVAVEDSEVEVFIDWLVARTILS